MKLNVTVVLLFFCSIISAQEGNERIEKNEYTTAALNKSENVKLDAVFNETLWNKVEWAGDFTVFQPNNGEAPTRQNVI